MAWHDDDQFWETWAPYLFSNERVRNATWETDYIVGLLEIPNGARVLDLCCGTGRHSIELARRGYSVTGVDRTHAYLERARTQAIAEGLKIEFVNCDVRSLNLSMSFDAAINMFTSFGYFDSEDDDLKVLRNVYAALRKSGCILIETEGKEVMARDFREREWWWHEDGSIGLQERKVSRMWDRMETRWILIRDRRIIWEGTVSSRIYSAVEFRRLIEMAGFSQVNIYGGLDGAPYDQYARGMIVVAVK